VNVTDGRNLFQILGCEQAMIESPLIDELVAKTRAEAILDFLESRFDSRPDDLADELPALGEQELKALNRFAAVCPDLEAFRARVRGSK
jgi:hypothetical protein